jgi:hypothetical protein
VRNAGLLAAHGKDPAAIQLLPRLAEEAGRELAIMKNISKATHKKANQEIAPVRFFHIMKNLRPFKRKLLERAQNSINTASNA